MGFSKGFKPYAGDPQIGFKENMPRPSKRVDFVLKILPSLGITGLTIWALFFANIDAEIVAGGFLICILLHVLIPVCINARDKALAREEQANTLMQRSPSRPSPNPPEIVKAYMEAGRGHWVRHYQSAGMADTQESIELAEQNRSLHLRGLCARETCYFCHHADNNAPYV